MIEFKTIQELDEQFQKGTLAEIPTQFTIDGVKYRYPKSNKISFDDMLTSGNTDKFKPMIFFSLDPTADNKARYKDRHTIVDESEFQDSVVFAWTSQRLLIRPVKAKFTSAARVKVNIKEAQIPDEKIIGHKISIVLRGFNGNNSIKAKVDTGATMCSLDANFLSDNPWKPGDETVTFEFGDRRVTMSCTSQGVKSADGGTEYRPVVKFDVELPVEDPQVTNKTLKGVQFNLNDRSGMPDKILLGQNFIKAGDFVVMNKSSEKKMIEGDNIDWDALQEEFAEYELQEEYIQLSNEHLLSELSHRLNK